MKPAISIIVPAYNAAKSLQRCLDSITAQSFGDFEVILIDDGSTDGTGELADAYAARDERFVVLHKANGGVAAARQDGLDHVRGEYTLFIDADDYADPTLLQKMYHSASENHSDMVICDFKLIRRPNQIEYWNQRPVSLDRKSLIGAMFYFCALWNKLIRTRCYRENPVRFAEGINAGEDQLFILRVLARNPSFRVSYVGEALYFYDLTQNGDSISNTGVSAEQRLLPLVLFSQEFDISSVQAAYDQAILHIAYDYLRRPDLCPHFRATFAPYARNFRAARGLPFHVKALVLLHLTMQSK